MDAGTEEVAFFDTNVLVAASLPSHMHHESSRVRLASLQKGSGVIAAHSLAEAYSILTKFPKGYGIPPADAASILSHASSLYRLVSLTPEETLRTVKSLAQAGLAGSLIYDALLLACARKVDAGAIFTHNVKHFRWIAPDLEDRIRIP